MGYPMTLKRVLNRNGLLDGGYTEAPQRHRKGVVTDPSEATLTDEESTKLARFDSLAARCERYEQAFKTLAGDIRRLENDTLDEEAICLMISARTNVDKDDVAAVLKEYFNV
jgi:hypothetical protein